MVQAVRNLIDWSLLSLNSSLRAWWPLASSVPQIISSVSSSNAQQRQPTAQSKSSVSSFSASLRPKSWKTCRRLRSRCSKTSRCVPLRVRDPDNARLAFDNIDALRGSHSISVARHLSNLTISPTYMHPQYQYPDGEYGEYANELQYLTSGRPNPSDGGYWENTRNEAVRYLTETPS